VRHVFRTVAGGLEDWDEEFIDTVQRIADSMSGTVGPREL
jgi:hypothetical protein